MGSERIVVTHELRERIALALDEDHVASGFTLGRVEHGEHRRMADLVLDALGLTPIPVDWCPLHSGVRNEDEHWCDFRDDSDPEQQCRHCDGTGVVEVGDGDYEGAGTHPEYCPKCEEGTTVCDLRTAYVVSPNGSNQDHAS